MITISNFKVNQKAEPTFAIIGYKSDDTYADLKYYPIQNNKLKAEIPFSFDCLNELREFIDTCDNKINTDIEFKSVIPKNILFVNKKDIVWTVNAGKKFLYFKEKIGVKSNYYFLPKLLFAFLNNELFVFALKKKDVVNENTKLYNAPFLNVYKNGNICMGNVNTNVAKFNYYEDIINFIEIAFFKSLFTHTNHNHIIDANIIDYFNNQNDENFNENLLLKSNTKSIKNLLNLI